MSGVTAMENLSIKIRRMFGAKRPPDEQRLMGWYEDALDLENACRNWEKAAELLRSKIRKADEKAALPRGDQPREMSKYENAAGRG